MTDDTPTQRIPETPAEGVALQEERKRSRLLLFLLLGVGAALLVAVTVLVTILVTQPRAGTVPQADATPPADAVPTATATADTTPSPTPTTAPSATPVQTPAAPSAPPDTSPGFAAFSAPAVKCPEPVESGEQPGPPAIITFSYTAKNAQSVWFIFGDEDAASQGIFPMPLQGNQSHVYGTSDPIYFPCNAASSTMTLTVVGNDGQHVNKTFTIVNNGYRD